MTLRLFTAKSLRDVYFVGRLVTNDSQKRGAIQLVASMAGFDREDDARAAIENTQPESGGESYLLLRVLEEYRPRHSLIQVLPADADA